MTREANALDDLDKAFLFLDKTELNVKAWKWVLLCLYNALYAFSVCVYASQSERNGASEPKTKKFVSFDEALRTALRCKEEASTPGRMQSIRELKKLFRDHFRHPLVETPEIETARLPRIVLDVIEVIRLLGSDPGCTPGFSEAHRRKIRSIAFRAQASLKQGRLYRESIDSRKRG